MSKLLNPLEVLVLKTKVGQEYADEIALFVLIHFDAAKRGRCTAQGYNFISRHLVQAQYIFARLKAPTQLALAKAAGMAWGKAGERQTTLLDLTTGEYNAVRAGLRAYLGALPRIECNTYLQACNVADQAMK